MADKIPVNTTPEGAALWFAGCRCGTAHHHEATRNGPDGPGRVLYCRNCGAEVALMAPRGAADDDPMAMARAAVPEGAVVTHAEFVHQETPQPIWTKRNLEEWAKAVLGENAIVFQNGQQICAEAATPGPLGYQVKRFYLQLEGDALVWKDQPKAVYRGIDPITSQQQFPGQQMGGGANGR